MKAKVWCWWFLAVTAATLVAASFSSDVRVVAPRGAYLGQAPPGTTPRVFAPGILSTAGRDEVSCAFTPDGRGLYFAIFEPGRGYTLRVMAELESGWTAERPAPFASDFSEVDPFITGDGRRCFFISKRPLSAEMERSRSYQIWVVHREGTSWGSPRPLGPAVNTKDRQLFPTVSDGKTLYFGSDRPGGFGGSDVYSARPEEADFGQPINLGAAINSSGNETDALIAPDGSFLVFTATDRGDGFGGGDFYISYRDAGGAWSPARNLGAEVNSPYSDFCPTLSPDGRYFFFTSNRKGSNDIFWVDADVIHSNRKAGEGIEGGSS
jgi:Tol biopolymer transport system component